MRSINSTITKLYSALFNVLKLGEKIDEVKMNQGRILVELYEKKKSKHLQDYEFKVFSQYGEDGIIQHLLDCIEIKNKTFIEFGVEDFFESNCRFLLMKDNWSGFVIDGSARNINRVKNSYFYSRQHLVAIDAFITIENINQLLAESRFDDDLGILSIDLDGNDYHVLEAIQSYRPRILICEYNAVFGATRKISVPYDPEFFRTTKHYSNLYWGASLSAMCHLARLKGYSFVGTNSASCNAFFVRDDLVNESVEVLDVEHAFSTSRYRESRDRRGRLTFVAGDERLKLIEGLPVFNVETKTIEPL